jgi:hypothetical protein
MDQAIQWADDHKSDEDWWAVLLSSPNIIAA